MGELKGESAISRARSPVQGIEPAPAASRGEIIALIRAFSAAVSMPGGGPHARQILEWTIEALDRRRADGAWWTPGTPESPESAREMEAGILQELKAQRKRWAAAESVDEVGEFAHAMDGLLMYEIAQNEARRGRPAMRRDVMPVVRQTDRRVRPRCFSGPARRRARWGTSTS